MAWFTRGFWGGFYVWIYAFYFAIMRMQDVTDALDFSTIKRKKRLTNAQLFLEVSDRFNFFH